MKSDERSISVLRLGGFLFCQFFFLAVIIYGGNLDAIYSHIQIQVFLPVKKKYLAISPYYRSKELKNEKCQLKLIWKKAGLSHCKAAKWMIIINSHEYDEHE